MIKSIRYARELGGRDMDACRKSGLSKNHAARSCADAAYAATCGRVDARSQTRAIACKNTTSISVPECGRRVLMWNLPRLASTSALVSDRLTPELSEAWSDGAWRAERLHRGGDFVVVEALAGIADPQHHLAEIRQRGGDDDLAAGIGEMDRVADQVQRDLAQRAGVGDHRRQRVRQRGPDDDAFAVGLRLHHRDAILDECR